MATGTTPRRSSGRAKIPIRHRLRNPPSVFVGRHPERQALHSIIERGAVAVVWGIGGLGKTALVTEVLHRDFAEQVDRTVMVGLRSDDPTALAVDIVKALAEARGLRGPRIAELLADADALSATAIDLADEGGLWLVLDDFHHADPAFGAELLRSAAAYSRNAKWIVTSRLDPELPEIAEQVLALGAMPQEDLALLAARCSPNLTEDDGERLARAANGSPWQLRISLTGASSSLVKSSEPPRQSPPPAPHLFATLWLVDAAVPIPALDELGVLPDEETTRSLERHGYIESTPAGLRLHDVARAVLEHPQTPPTDERARIGSALVSTAIPTLMVAAARMHLEAGDIEKAQQLLETNADRILRNDEAPRMWQLLDERSEPWAQTLKLRCAVEIGSGPALAWAIHLPEPTEDGDRLLRLKAFIAAGELETASAHAKHLLDKREAKDIRVEAGLIFAYCAIVRTEASLALDTLDTLDTESAEQTAQKNVLRARALILLSRFSEALEIGESLRRELDSLEPEAQRDVNEQLVVVYRNLGHMRTAKEANMAAHRGSVALVRSQRSLVRLAGDHLEQGELAAGRDLLERLRPYVEAAPHLRPLFWMNQIRWQMSFGEFGSVQGILDQLLSDAERTRNAEFYQWAMIGVLYFAMETARPASELPYSAEMPLPSGPQDPYIAVYFRMHLLRSREAEAMGPVTSELKRRAISRTAPADYPDLVDVQSMAHQCQAVQALFDGQTAEAAASAARGVELAEDHGWVMFGADARRLQCQILVALDRLDDAKTKIAAFRTATQPFGSPRFDKEHALLASLVDDDGPTPATLESVAAAADVAPTAARIARALLDRDSRVDRVEDAMLKVLAQWPWIPKVRTIVGSGAQTTGWGIDEIARCVWLPDGTTRDLSAHPTSIRLLAALARRGGTIDKEHLARDVWNVTSYHPLNDDGRIHVAVRRVRQQIEDEPSKPTRLCTTPQGYSLGGSESVRFREASS